MDSVHKVYADAVLRIGQEEGPAFLEELTEEQGFLYSLMGNEEFRFFFESPEVPKDVKLAAIDKAFSGRCTEVTKNYLKVLLRNGRQFEIRGIARAFEELYLEHKHRIKVFVFSATELAAEDLRELQFVVEEKYDRDAMFIFKQDPTLLGGLIVRVGDVQIDGSLKGRLNDIKSRLLKARVPDEVISDEA